MSKAPEILARGTKPVEIEVCSRWESYSRDELVARLDEVVAQIPEELRSTARFEVVQESIPYSDGERSELRCTYQRPETVKELADRQEQHTKNVEMRRKADLETFERLRKELGK